MSGKNLPKNPAVMASIQQRARAGESVYQIARATGFSTTTIRHTLKEPSIATPTGAEVLEAMGVPDPTAPVYDYNIEEPIQPAIRDPRHTNGMAERVGGHTINVATNPRGADFRFRVSHRPPSAGFPERTEPAYPSTARGTHLNLFDPHSEY